MITELRLPAIDADEAMAEIVEYLRALASRRRGHMTQKYRSRALRTGRYCTACST